MNSFVSSHAVKAGKPECAAAGRKPFQFSLNRDDPAPPWQRASVRAIGFRQADPGRAHWKKVWRSMFEV